MVTHAIHDSNSIDPDPNVLSTGVLVLAKLGGCHVHGGAEVEAVQGSEQPKDIGAGEVFRMGIVDEQ